MVVSTSSDEQSDVTDGRAGAHDSATPSVKSAERVLGLLERLSHANAPVTLAELQHELGFPRSSLHALLTTMERKRWVKAADDGGYVLGPASRILGAGHEDDASLAELADDVLIELRDKADETVHMARLELPNVFYLSSRLSPHMLDVRLQPGRKIPAHCTALGKAMLAEHPSVELHNLNLDTAPTTPKTIQTQQDLREELARTRDRGYAIDDEEFAVGLRCFAVSIRLPSTALRAISCSAAIARLDPDKETLIKTALMDARQRLLDRLGRRLSD